MKMTDNEGFDIFYLRDDNIKKEENDAHEHDLKKKENVSVSDAEILRNNKTVEIIKFAILILILITSTVAMIFAIRIYYTQSDTQQIVFPGNVMEYENQPAGDIVVDTAEEIDVAEIFTTQVYIDLSPEVVQQPGNATTENKNPSAAVSTTKVSEVTTVKTEAEQTTVVATTQKTSGRININIASVDELMTLDGIGEKKANAIISYRNENGAFLSVDELLEVDGIGEKTVEKLRPYITVDY